MIFDKNINSEEPEPFLLLPQIMKLQSYRKWLFFLIIVAKVPLVVAKSNYFLKRKFSEMTKKNGNFLEFSFPWFDISICN